MTDFLCEERLSALRWAGADPYVGRVSVGDNAYAWRTNNPKQFHLNVNGHTIFILKDGERFAICNAPGIGTPRLYAIVRQLGRHLGLGQLEPKLVQGCLTVTYNGVTHVARNGAVIGKV